MVTVVVGVQIRQSYKEAPPTFYVSHDEGNHRNDEMVRTSSG